jgi:hypothetical protein
MVDFVLASLLGIIASGLFLIARAYRSQIRSHNVVSLTKNLIETKLARSRLALSIVLIGSSALLLILIWAAYTHVTLPGTESLVHLILGLIFGVYSVIFVLMATQIVQAQSLQEGALFRVLLAASITASPLILDLLARFLKEESITLSALEVASLKLSFQPKEGKAAARPAALQLERSRPAVMGFYTESFALFWPSLIRDAATAKEMEYSQEAVFATSYDATITFLESFIKPASDCALLAKAYDVPKHTLQFYLSPLALSLSNLLFDIRSSREALSGLSNDAAISMPDQGLLLDLAITKQVEFLDSHLVLAQDQAAKAVEQLASYVLKSMPVVDLTRYFSSVPQDGREQMISSCASALVIPRHSRRFSLEDLDLALSNPYTHMSVASLFVSLDDNEYARRLLLLFEKENRAYAPNLTYLLSYILEDSDYDLESTLLEVGNFIKQLDNRAARRFKKAEWLTIDACGLEEDKREIWFRYFFLRAQEVNRFVYRTITAQPGELYTRRRAIMASVEEYATFLQSAARDIMKPRCVDGYIAAFTQGTYDEPFAAASFYDTYAMYVYSRYLQTAEQSKKKEAEERMQDAVALAQSSSVDTTRAQAMLEVLSAHLDQMRVGP